MDNFKNRLILYTRGSELENITPETIKVLQKNNFIDIPWQYQNQEFYLAGSELTRQLMFCGCSPCVELKPQETGEPGSNFLAIQFIAGFGEDFFYAGKQPFRYSCSQCHTSVSLKNKKIHSIEGQNSFFTCPQCLQQYFYHKVNWRRKAGYGQFFIEIRGVFESEALPSDKLMQILQDVTNTQWYYFYADESSFLS